MNGYSCEICGATETPVRAAMWRYVVFEPGHQYGSGYRCVDEATCRSDVDLTHELDPAIPGWNIADGGPAAVSKPATSWKARAGATAPDPAERPAITGGDSDPGPSRFAPTTGEQVGAW